MSVSKRRNFRVFKSHMKVHYFHWKKTMYRSCISNPMHNKHGFSRKITRGTLQKGLHVHSSRKQQRKALTTTKTKSKALKPRRGALHSSPLNTMATAGLFCAEKMGINHGRFTQAVRAQKPKGVYPPTFPSKLVTIHKCYGAHAVTIVVFKHEKWSAGWPP